MPPDAPVSLVAAIVVLVLLGLLALMSESLLRFAIELVKLLLGRH